MRAVPDRRVLATVSGFLSALAVLTAVELAAPPEALDVAILDGLFAHRTPGWTSLATAVTNTGASPVAYLLVAAAGVVVRLRTGRWRPGLTALAVLVAGVLSRLALSVVVGDARPAPGLRLVAASGYSFPSGHTAASALLAGTLIWLAGRAGWPRWPVAAVLVPWAVAVGLTRMYLGVHWITDVAGSWLLAGAALCALPLLDPDPAVR